MFGSKLASYSLFFLWVLFALAHVVFLKLFLYWHFDWLDIFMHTWGGFLVVATWYQIRNGGLFKRVFSNRYFHPLLFLIVAMIAWEVFKYLIGSTVSQNYRLDTTFDLLSGFLGGLVAFFSLRFSTMRSNIL